MDDTTAPTRGDATRARLLDAAVRTFAAKGFHAATTRDIAAEAQMSPAALYVHHRSKEELLYLISRAGHERTLEIVERAATSSDDPTSCLVRVVHDFSVDHARGHTTARIVNYELGALLPPHYAEIAAVRRRTEQAVVDLIDRGRASGHFDVADVRMTALAVLSLGIDIARWYRDEGRWTPEDVGEHYATLALRLVGATSTPRA